MPTEDTYRLLRAFVDELCRCGMRDACTSPGSRNTPIVLSLVREPRLRCFSHIDERCAGFFALGAAKASGRPVAVTCTSGTAAAELAPAVVEAHWARVPLIVLTADRPAELRDVGAGQAIDQLKLYGSAAKWFAEVELGPVLDAAAMRAIRRLACRAYATALQGPAGPVHLNLPLREPLVLDAPLPPEPAGTGVDPAFRGRPAGAPWTARETAGPHRVIAGGVPARTAATHTVIVAGRIEADPRLAVAVSECAVRIGAPVLADPLSGARGGPHAIATYDVLLRDAELGAALAPVQVIRVGDLPTSKPLRVWLAGLGAPVHQVALDPDSSWQDPDAATAEVWSGDPVATLDALAPAARLAGRGRFLERWLAADDAAQAALTAALGERGLSEPLVARRLGEWLDPRTTLFVAASMPIRDVEEFFPARVPLPRVLANRGANGIDGTISSAFGAAAGTEPRRPVVLLVGDVTLLHDLGGLVAARRLGLELTIVVVNNDGGGIFHFLPVSGEGAAFEEHVATPHGLSLRRVAELFGLRHERPESEAELRAAVDRGIGSGTVSLVEIVTDRAANRALHAELADAALAATRAHRA